MGMNSFLITLILLLVIIKNENYEPLNLDDFYYEVDPNYMNQVISNLTQLSEIYAYLDIIKNPPNSFHPKIDLKEELNKIDTTKSKLFYDFYRDIIRIIGKMKDIHTVVLPKKNQFLFYLACIPFSFGIKLDENKEYQIYIKKSSTCPFNYSDSELSKFIDDAANGKKSILSINDKEPFDFFQDFGKEFFSLKNEHARFTFILEFISKFPLYMIPFNITELNLKIKLSNNEEKTFPYFIYFDDEYGIYSKLEKLEYEWNYINKHFRCRVDEKNKLNVFYQNSFDDFDEKEMYDLIFNCSRLFHSNNYKIVGIECKNTGGYASLSTYLQQMLQPKICANRQLSTLRQNKYLESIFQNISNDFLDVKTCKHFKSFEEILEKNPDNYGNDIKHYRTKVLDEIPLELKLDMHQKRKELINTNNTKKPTDIIIFTDYNSISSTSVFLKGLQQTGGAIIVGYFGNPKNKKAIRDSGVSSSGDIDPSNLTPFKNLNELGIEIYFTSFEMYSYDYQDKNPIPQEYTSYIVDEHVDIYEEYSESNYQKFIDEANKIFEKYKTKCNKNNKLLLLENNNCLNIKGDKHTHGGYLCGDDGEWDNTKCQAYYCDLGYYYDTYQKKCIEDICTKSDNNENDDDGNNSWVLIITIIGLCLSLLIVIIFIIILYKRKSNINSEINEDFGLMESY